MKHDRIIRIIAALLLLGLLAGCGTVAPVPTQTAEPSSAQEATAPAPEVTPAPTSKPTAQPTPKPASEPTPDPTPDPTPEPTPELMPVNDLPGDLPGSEWCLYAYEVEGSFEYAWENSAENWLTFFGDSAQASFYDRYDGGLWRAYTGMSVMRDEAGTLRFHGEEEGFGMDFAVITWDEQDLELSCSWVNPDGTPGGNTLWFSRVHPQEDGRPLDEEETARIAARFGPGDWGFFRTLYAYPQEIDWAAACAGGADIAREPTEDELAAWEERYGAAEGELMVIRKADLPELADRKTYTDYREAQNPLLWWFEPDEEHYMGYRDPAAQEPVQFRSMYWLRERLTVYFTLPEDEETVYRARLYRVDQEGSGLVFLSVSKAGGIAPRQLAMIRFFETREEAEAVSGVTACIPTEHLDSDEPNWVWAVVTTWQDELHYSFQRCSMSGENANAMEALIGAKIPDQILASGELGSGESVALEVNLAWYPRLRLELTQDYYWGEYWFGQENWNPGMEPDTRRYVTGHDLDGEGRGCSPLTEEELMNVLSDRPWLLTDDTGQDILACLLFYADGRADIILRDTWYSLQGQYFRLNAREDQAPDAVTFTAGTDVWSTWTDGSEDGKTVRIGDYALSLIQLPGEQILSLYQIGDRGSLGLMLPGSTEEDTAFYFRRYMGATPIVPVG